MPNGFQFAHLQIESFIDSVPPGVSCSQVICGCLTQLLNRNIYIIYILIFHYNYMCIYILYIYIYIYIITTWFFPWSLPREFGVIASAHKLESNTYIGTTMARTIAIDTDHVTCPTTRPLSSLKTIKRSNCLCCISSRSFAIVLHCTQHRQHCLKMEIERHVTKGLHDMFVII